MGDPSVRCAIKCERCPEFGDTSIKNPYKTREMSLKMGHLSHLLEVRGPKARSEDYFLGTEKVIFSVGTSVVLAGPHKVRR